MRLFGRPSTINLALQGGGAHGAFTWGVLDALLEDGRTDFDGVSGASAGAMNAAVLAQGLMSGGRDGAREALRQFWTAVAAAVPDSLTLISEDGRTVGPAPMLRLLMEWSSHLLSPSQMNPFDLNPLRDILNRQIDFARLRQHSPVQLFISATAASSGRLRLFRNAEISSEVLLASACLPTVFRPIVIDGQAYWDGGYAANPAVFPLFFECRSRDILLVLLNPLNHAVMPSTAAGIHARVTEIGFTTAFLREMRMFAQLRRHVPRRFLGLQIGGLERRVRHTRFHMIEGGEMLAGFGAQTKMAANLKFFERLQAAGREHGQAWLERHFADLGRRSTVDLEKTFL